MSTLPADESKSAEFHSLSGFFDSDKPHDEENKRAIPDGANSSSSATPLKDSTHSNASTTSAHSSRKIPCHETLLKNMHSLIEEINAKRKQDTNMMDDYKKAIDILVQKSYSMLEQKMFEIYESQSAAAQKELDELIPILDDIGKLEAELNHYREALGGIYQNLS